jgi:hypothetical protein
MKTLKHFSLLALILMFCQTISAQKYFVYDGDDFSVMFTCNTDNTQVLEVEYSAKDSNEEWQWYKFDIYDSDEFEDLDELGMGGFVYYCTDASGNKYVVDYFTEEDYVVVTATNTDGSSGTTWTLERRAEEK